MSLKLRSVRVFSLVTGVAVALSALGACGSESSDDGSGTKSAAPKSSNTQTETIRVAIVPTLGLGVLKLGEEQGYFSDEGLEVELTPVDSGPNIIAGLIAGQYDVGYTAYAPPLLAQAAGEKLVVISGLSVAGPNGTNGAVFVRKDGDIKDWKDLEGKKLGTNAPKSLAVLWVQDAIQKAGGDPQSLELVPLPFNQIAEKVDAGQIDAGISLEPYTSATERDFTDLVNLGDPSLFPEGSPSGGVISTEKTATEKKDLLERYTRALDKSVAYANDHLDEVRTAGAELTGLDAESAKSLYLGKLSTDLKASDLEPLVNSLLENKWIEKEPDLKAFVGK